MNGEIGLRVCFVLTRRTRELNFCIWVGIFLARVWRIRMIGGKVVEIGRSLQKLWLVWTLFAIIGKILFMITLNVIMHRILLLLYNLTVRAHKFIVRILLILG